MTVKKENLEVDDAAERCRPIELITENAFSVVRVGECDAPRRAPGGRHVFMVRDPQGCELEITVEIDKQVVNEVILRSRERISRESSYWICCAERHLAEYLYENDNYPPDGKLTVEQLTPEDLYLAIRWRIS